VCRVTQGTQGVSKTRVDQPMDVGIELAVGQRQDQLIDRFVYTNVSDLHRR